MVSNLKRGLIFACTTIAIYSLTPMLMRLKAAQTVPVMQTEPLNGTMQSIQIIMNNLPALSAQATQLINTYTNVPAARAFFKALKASLSALNGIAAFAQAEIAFESFTNGNNTMRQQMATMVTSAQQTIDAFANTGLGMLPTQLQSDPAIRAHIQALQSTLITLNSIIQR